MSAICSCSPSRVSVKETKEDHKYCETCGYWWDPKYGSYEHGQKPRMAVNRIPKTGRNDPCPCGSGRKFKRCCISVGGGAS